MKKFILFFLFSFTSIWAANEPINLIWLMGKEGSWEEDWVHEIVADVKADIHEFEDPNYELFLDKSIIVTSYPNKEKYRKYFATYRKLGYKFGIIHLSDEAYEHPTDFYSSSEFVIRNYWHEKFANNKKLLFFPLGYKRLFWNCFQGEVKDSISRKYTWSFAGQIAKSTRRSMINNMKKIPNYYIHEIFDFNAPNALSAQDYRDVLLESIFVPCPRGWLNLDTFRLSEALECGCIPIVENSPNYFGKFFGFYPFLSVASWDEIPKRINELLADPDRLEQLRISCQNWWLEYKRELRKRVADLVESNL